MIYKWQEGGFGGITKFDPQIVGEALVDISKRYAKVTLDTILVEAKKVTSPLHPMFEWDDSKAADIYRRDRASRIVRCIVVVRSDRAAGYAEGKPLIAKIKINNKRSFVSTASTRTNPDYQKQLTKRAVRELRNWYDKYWDLCDLKKLMVAIEEAWPEEEKDLPNKYETEIGDSEPVEHPVQ